MLTPRLRVAAGALVALLTVSDIQAQGCVAASGSGMSCELEFHETQRWQVGVGYRWFESDRHFRGTHEEKNRRAEGSEVINNSHFTDVALTYAFSPRYSATLTVPYVSHDRSQVVRNSQREILRRFHTQSSGLADVRIEGNGWLFDPMSDTRGNVLFGLGIELPTGKKDVRDTFQTFHGASGQIVAQERTVDQSIQPGDGGYAVALSVYAYRDLAPNWRAYFNGNYDVTPQEKNGVPTFRSNPFEAEMSIVDRYLARGGLEYMIRAIHGLTLSLGGRMEGVPVHDLIGGSKGFRRPGYSVAVEPGVAYTSANWNARLYVPVAVQRNRQQSVPDKQQSAATGVRSVGDAAFADYAIMVSAGYRF
jgi:hypothetical protein